MVKGGQKYLRPYEDPVPVVEDITGMRILKGAFLLFGGDEKKEPKVDPVVHHRTHFLNSEQPTKSYCMVCSKLNSSFEIS